MKNNSRKIIILILTLILCFPTVVGAKENQVEANVPVSVMLETINGQAPKEDYKLTIEREDGSKELLPNQTMINVSSGEKSQFGPISYNVAGDYYYIIKQIPGEDDFTIYDESVYRVGVHVRNIVDDNNIPTGELVVSQTIRKNGLDQKPDDIQFINKYNKPAPKEVKDNIVVKKSIKGDKPSEDAEFKFLLKGISSNVVGMKYIPFPQASTNLEKIISIKGSGSADFGDIAFTKPGEYTYQVSEINTGDKNYKYDDAKYEITFKVVCQDDNTLKVNKSITKNGKSTEVIEFQNEYKKPTKPITVTPAPETGDNMNIILIVAVIAVACIGLVLLTIKNKKR